MIKLFRPMRVFMLASVLAALGMSDADAQVPVADRLRTPARLTGEIGSFGEFYSVAGRESRRPSSTGRLYLRSSLDLFGVVTVGLNLQYSTESGTGIGIADSRQPFNQIGIAPQWSWGRGYLGSFNDSYSSLSWDGVRVRGLGFNINPGPVRLGAFHGRSQSALAGGALDGAYRRDLSGGRIGIGRHSGTGQSAFVDLVFIRAADDPGSLPAAMGEAGGSPELVNEFAVTPQENIVMAAVSRVPLWQGRLVLSGEAAASVHSRDVRAPELTDDALDEYVGLLRSFITPRASTYGDIAHNGKVELRDLPLPGATRTAPLTVSAGVGYRYVGAGYVSLGLASLPADQKAVTADVSVRSSRWNASLRAMQQTDNLLDQKLATTTRHRIAGTASARLSTALRSTFRASVNTVNNETDAVARAIDYASLLIGTTQTLALGPRRRVRAISLNYGYQQSGDGAPGREGNDLRAHDASVRATLQLAPTITVTPSTGVALSRLGDSSWQARHTYSVAAQFRVNSQLSTSASFSNSRLNAGGSLHGAISARYTLASGDQVTFGLRSNRVSGLQTAAGGFHENRATLAWSRTIR
jgi:hypothetical protein